MIGNGGGGGERRKTPPHARHTRIQVLCIPYVGWWCQENGPHQVADVVVGGHHDAQRLPVRRPLQLLQEGLPVVVVVCWVVGVGVRVV